MFQPAFPRRLASAALIALSLLPAPVPAQDPAPTPPAAPPAGQDPAPKPDGGAPASNEFPAPPPIPEVVLGPTLKTHPIRRTPQGYTDLASKKDRFGEQWIDASVLPRDKKGIWVLDFAFRPLRMIPFEDEKGRRDVYYMYYQVINRTGEPRMFVPQFTLVTDTGKRYEDTVLPQAVKLIRVREDATITNLYGAPTIQGMVPPSNRQGVEDAVFGVAVFEGIDPHADRLTVFVRGLSDGYRSDPGANPSDKPVTRYKALKIDFIRRGDQHDPHEREITLADPPYDWTYR